MIETLYVTEAAYQSDSQELLKGLMILKNQLAGDGIGRVDDISKATYVIYKYGIDPDYALESTRVIHKGRKEVRTYPIFDTTYDCFTAIKSLNHDKYNWEWKYEDYLGYEVTSRGDRRFSPFFQYINHNGSNISLEDFYKTVIKPLKESGKYEEGTGHKLMKGYLFDKPGLLYELACIGVNHPFTDMFDKLGGQNKWYAEILNELIK